MLLNNFFTHPALGWRASVAEANAGLVSIQWRSTRSVTRHREPVHGEKHMPVQKFAPMTKDFPTFDCDAHVTEPPWLWERARDYLTKDEFEALKSSIWFDPESKQLIVNGYANTGLDRRELAAIPACSMC